MSDTREQLETKLAEMGQQHLLAFWDECSDSEKKALSEQIKKLNSKRLRQFKKLINEQADSATLTGEMTPLPVVRLPETPEQKKQQDQYKKTGETALKNGRVAAVLVAGGQGSRLGFHHPKGMFPVGPVTRRTLFQYHTEKTRALEQKYNTTIPFYIMTSHANDQETRSFYNENNCFGKSEDTIHFFKQNMLPAMDAEGKLLLKNKHELFTSPDGHGGTINALYQNGLFDDMAQNGIEYLFYFQVDNALVQICDPVYIGAHIQNQADMSAKTIYKRSWDEKLGIPVKRNGKNVVVEYSELSEADKKATTKDGTWVYGQGSIAIHVFDVKFLKTLVQTDKELPFHLAHKKIEYIQPDGTRVKPDKPNAYKFEQFIFDAMPEADQVMIMETDRSREFSPIKNKKGQDSPETARQDISEYYAEWLEQAGVSGLRDENGDLLCRVEISPLFALTADELKEKLPVNYKPMGDIVLD
ncbi:MAG: UDPGP type 1 family protein [candidate division KSB1 bacterium]|nr:UDPGP type 1 family protein [candidate division KSB1 bacterium]